MTARTAMRRLGAGMFMVQPFGVGLRRLLSQSF
jgi:hypothetical protein